jgi:hypothetical protein
MPSVRCTRWLIGFAVALGALLALPSLAGGVSDENRLFVELDGDSEVGGGDPDANGFGMVDLFKRQREVCFNLSWVDKTEPVRSAHIHKGRAGDDGGIKVTLWGPDESGGNAAGCVDDVGRRLIKRLRENPRRYYVNLHNGEFPEGAIRGQLRQEPPPVCGGTCWPEPPHPGR